MKVLILMLCALLVLPSIYAVGLGTPSDMDDEMEVDVGEEWEYTFLLRGDSEEQDVQFYVVPEKSGLIRVNGLTAGYKKNYNLEPFEDVYIDVDFEAVDGGVTEVIWGFKYLDASSGDGFSFEQAVEQKFTVEIDERLEDNEDVDVDVKASTSSSGGSSGGAGGGGAGSAPIVDEKNAADDKSSRSDDVSEEASLQDISAQGSSTSEMVAGAGSERYMRTVLDNVGDVVVNVASGKVVLIILLGLLIGGAITSVAAAKVAKGDDNES